MLNLGLLKVWRALPFSPSAGVFVRGLIVGFDERYCFPVSGDTLVSEDVDGGISPQHLMVLWPCLLLVLALDGKILLLTDSAYSFNFHRMNHPES